MLGAARRHKWLLVGVVAAVLVTALVLRARRPVEVGVATVHRGPLRYSIAASGIVEGESADLGFQGAGRVVGVYVREGDAIHRSQLLARLSPLPATPDTLGASDVIQAPYDGRVVTLYQRTGAVVSPGQPVVGVVADGPPWLTAFVESEDAVRLGPGQKLRCRAGGYLGQSWELTVAEVGRQAVPRPDLPGSTRQVRVRCEVTGQGFPLPPGSEVDVDGDITLVADALLIPTAAVVREGAGESVLTVREGRVARVPIRVGPNNFEEIQVTEGLSEGDTVVVEGKAGLTEGQRVRIRPVPAVGPASAMGNSGAGSGG
jgi:multidrug efflux pump subunit AcrA (membrane-fusion protein)